MTKTQGRIRPCHLGLSRPTTALDADVEHPDPADPDDQRQAGEHELGEQLVADASPEICCRLGVPDRVVDGGQQVRGGVAVQEDDHADRDDANSDQRRENRRKSPDGTDLNLIPGLDRHQCLSVKRPGC